MCVCVCVCVKTIKSNSNFKYFKQLQTYRSKELKLKTFDFLKRLRTRSLALLLK